MRIADLCQLILDDFGAKTRNVWTAAYRVATIAGMSTLEAHTTATDDGRRRSRVGQRLRQARDDQGLSLRALAERIGVSASLISQVERGQVMPSVSTLYGIVRELDLSMDELFAEPRTAPPAAEDHVDNPADPAASPVLRGSDRATIYLASGVRWERLTTAADPVLDFQVAEYAVGAESCPPHALMTHGGREYGYVITGALEVTVGAKTYELGPGDSIHFPSTTPHRLANVGNVPTSTLWAVVGRKSDARPVG
jgi:transcriptional regulator with XRE-family HTH domain